MLPRIHVSITMAGDPSAGIQPITDAIQLWWDLDELPDERERVRNVLQRAWGELYDDTARVTFADECPDCHRPQVNCRCEPPAMAAEGEKNVGQNQ